MITIVRVVRDNYCRFQRLVHWRVTGERHPASLPAPGEAELSFAQREGFWVWAAEIDGEFVGWLNCVFIPKPDQRVGLLYVDELWTAPEFRRRGVAEALMEKAVDLARELPAWKVRLYVGRDNPAARSFYRQMGFTEDDECMFCQRQP